MMILLTAAVLGMMPRPVEPLPTDLTRYFPLVDVIKPTNLTIALTIDQTGTPVRCEVVTPSASGKFDHMGCEVLMQRARFRPAVDEAGAPVAAIVDHAIGLNTGVPRPHPVDFALPVSRVAAPNAVADARVVTGPDGRITSCAVAVSSGTAALDRLVCPGIANVAFPAAHAAGGAPMRAMRLVSVGFAVGDIGHRID